MSRPPPSGPHSDIDGLHRSAVEGNENRHLDTGTAEEGQQNRHEAKAKPARYDQKPGGNDGNDS